MRQWQGYRNGINLGGWLSQCDICDRKHLDSFIQEADIRQIAKTGLLPENAPAKITEA